MYCPENSAGEEKLNGKMLTLQQALAYSINYVSAYLIKQFGANAVADLAHRLSLPADATLSPERQAREIEEILRTTTQIRSTLQDVQ